MTETPEYYYSPLRQLLILIALVFGCLIIGGVLSIALIILIYGKDVLAGAMAISTSSSPQVLDAFKILLGLGNTLACFFAPAVIFGYWVVSEPEDYLKIDKRHISWILLALVVLIVPLSFPGMELLSNFNQKMVLPEFMHSIEKWMRDSENEAARSVGIVLQMKTLGSFFSSLLIVGLLPALSEEFFFRGAMQTVFERWTKNPHAAIWITAVIFSAVHFEFYGFLPRMMLGAFFGYLVFWSGSIWTSVLAHFILNGSQVLLVYLYQNKMTNINPDEPHLFSTTIYITSLVIFIFMLWLYKRIALNRTPALEE